MSTISAETPINNFHLTIDVVSSMSNGDLAGTGVALLSMGAGLRALPVEPHTKRPFGFLTPHGAKDATGCPVTFRQWAALAEDAWLGIVPGQGFAVIDDDEGGRIDLAQYGVAGTLTEQTRRGQHAWVRIPDGRRLRKSRLPDGAGDLITGDSSYVVMSPSLGYTPLDPTAPILMPPDESPLWDQEGFPEGTSITSPELATTSQDLQTARRTVGTLLRGEFGPKVNQILEGKHKDAGYDSRSEADAALAFMATHHLRNNPRALEVLVALLDRYSRKAYHLSMRQSATTTQEDRKGRPRLTGAETYIVQTAQSALHHRACKDRERISEFKHTIMIFSSRYLPPPLHPLGVSDPKDRKPRGKKKALIRSLVAFAMHEESDSYSRGQGWRRVPVQDMAGVFNTSAENVRLALKAAEEAGLLERSVIAIKHDGTYRRDSLVRLTGAPADWGKL